MANSPYRWTEKGKAKSPSVRTVEAIKVMGLCMINKMSDKELIAGFLGGSEDCYLELIERYTDKAFNLAFRYTRSQEDAEEVLQDVFVTVHNKLQNFEGKAAFSSWLYRITVNTALMLIRKKRQTPTVSVEEIAPQIRESWTGEASENKDVDFISSRHELRAALDSAVGKLPEEYRNIFLMRDVDGLSNQEVSEVLGMSVPAVKSRLHRARLMLRKKLHKFYNDYTCSDMKEPEIIEADEFLMAA